MVLPSSEAKGTSSPMVQALNNLVSSRGLKRQRERPFSDRHQKSVFQGSDSEEERHEQSDQKQDKDEVHNMPDSHNSRMRTHLKQRGSNSVCYSV